ncbi:MAG: glycoside hydrolase family 99-like domain-containing protein [Actinomycetota bacterium]|nr:glycoside hydrolase family 99-like domain-containing protein [Actinomycetota bacterium]
MSDELRGEAAETGTSVLARPATIAFYLPQYHPIPENDRAWGDGFTDWHNVAKARPRFSGHRQPVLPGALGFYDLRLDQTRRDQMALARRGGVDGFCWYHYWFSGRRLLHEPFERMRRDPEEDFPFMLCWANEAWTRRWSGLSGEVIVRQRYSAEDNAEHIRYLVDVFADDRYIRVDGKPVFLIYRPTDVPDLPALSGQWRGAVERAGFPGLVLLGVESFRSRIAHPERMGLDGVVGQQPDLGVTRPAWRAAPRVLAASIGVADRYPNLVRCDYGRIVRAATERAAGRAGQRYWMTVCPGWDNSPRRGRGAVVITGSSPEAYGAWLEEAMETTTRPIVFVNAWNEWAEGAHLEPDCIDGTAYLDAHRAAVDRARGALAGGAGSEG